MALFNKSDLKYSDYKWTAYPSDDPKITGVPDSTLFNRHEGYEMLYLINKVMEIWGFKYKNSAEKIEKMLRESLPSDIRSQAKVKEWLDKNWK